MTNRLRDIRIDKRMTQEELADRSGVTRQTIIAIETDPNYNTTYRTLTSLADALNVTVDQLFLP